MQFIKFLFYRIQRLYLYLFFSYKINISCNKIYIGNIYGGFYLNNDKIDQNSIIFSFGIGKDISFDLEMISLYNCKIFGFDPTPESINWVKSQFLPNKFHFFPFGIGVKDNSTKFYLPIDKNNISGSIFFNTNNLVSEPINVKLKTLDTISNELCLNQIDILKMDIEGSEYQILQNLPNDITIRQILVEFHNRNFKNGNSLAKQTIKNLHKKGYRLFSISETNTELSFININYL